MSDSPHSVVAPSRAARRFAAAVVVLYALITLVPLAWIVLTSFKSPSDAISYPPKLLFQPTLEGYVNLFTTRSRQAPEILAAMPPPQTWYDRLARTRNMVIVGPSRFIQRYGNSLVIAVGSTVLAVGLGTLAAYAPSTAAATAAAFRSPCATRSTWRASRIVPSP